MSDWFWGLLFAPFWIGLVYGCYQFGGWTGVSGGIVLLVIIGALLGAEYS